MARPDSWAGVAQTSVNVGPAASPGSATLGGCSAPCSRQCPMTRGQGDLQLLSHLTCPLLLPLACSLSPGTRPAARSSQLGWAVGSLRGFPGCSSHLQPRAEPSAPGCLQHPSWSWTQPNPRASTGSWERWHSQALWASTEGLLPMQCHEPWKPPLKHPIFHAVHPVILSHPEKERGTPFEAQSSSSPAQGSLGHCNAAGQWAPTRAASSCLCATSLTASFPLGLLSQTLSQQFPELPAEQGSGTGLEARKRRPDSECGVRRRGDHRGHRDLPP